MRVLLAALALLPSLAVSQVDLGTYQITSGQLAGARANMEGSFAGNGFAGSLIGYPAQMYDNIVDLGENAFSMAISPMAGRDNGLYLIPGSIDGLVPVFGPDGYEQSGELTTGSVNVTGPGIYTTSFTMSADVDYGAPGATSPSAYVNFVGSGTFTVDVGQTCSGGVCSWLYVSYADYAFAPELDPASLETALTLLVGGLMVLRGRPSNS
jgi:hypothetical protein